MKLNEFLARVKRKAVKRLAEWTSHEAYCTYVSISILAMQGLWPGKKMSWKSARTIYIRVVALISLHYCSMTLPVGVYTHWSQGISIVVEQIACWFLISTVLIYIWTFHFCSNRYERVIHSMEAMLRCGRFYKDCPMEIRNQTKLLSDLTLGSLIFYNILAGFVLIAQIPYLRARRIFFFNGWYPKFYTELPFYDVMIFVSTMFLLSGALTITSCIVFLISLFIQAIEQFKLLNHNLPNVLPRERKRIRKNLIHTDAKRRHSPIQHNVKHSKLNQNTNEKVNKRIGQSFEKLTLSCCIRHHQKILSFVREIESSFQPMLMVQCVGCVIPSVLAIALVVYAKEFDLKMFMMFTVVAVVNLNLALYCLLADYIAEESSLVADAIYNCDWLSASAEFKRSIRIIMARANRPIHIKVAGFLPLTNEQFVQIMRLTYSYYISLTTYLHAKPN